MIRLATVFSGIGAIEHALNRMGVDNKIVFACDNGDVDILRKYINERGKILPRRVTGACAKHQRVIANEIKRARAIALLPFTK